MSYNGFFIRDYIGETIDSSTGTNWTNSPDIICPGPTPLPDPSVIINASNYNDGTPSISNQTPLVNNWVYVRGVNPQSVPQTSTVFLYYVDTSIILWPQNWKYDTITFGGTTQNWFQLDAPASSNNQGIAGTIAPFGWIPPRNNIHYCLVAWATNGADQLTPPDLGAIGTVNDMATFILSHPNIGWKNTTEVDATVPTMQGSASIIGPSAGGVLNLGLQCHKLPTDGYIEFSVPGPDSDNTIIFPKTPIISTNYAPTFQVEYPPNFTTQMNWTYYQGATPCPDGANVIPISGTWGLTESFIDHVRKVAPGHLVGAHFYGTPAEFLKRDAPAAMLSGPPKNMMIVGSVPFKMVR
ncbi:hypothetical protein A0256_19660 [Mucilaginibacter sp. PAMC 26640]|nr:hypothetical protein A0256_19660 [Mucilaginibacter sp. PAMC 26640]